MNTNIKDIQRLNVDSIQSTLSDRRFESNTELQNYLLQGVSRTFALTIPQLPEALRSVVSNAYLLCRIIDTIEDEPALSFEQKQQFANQFVALVDGQSAAQSFFEQLAPLLSESTIPAEHELIKLTTDVIHVTHSFNTEQQAALSCCVRTMAEGMIEFQKPGNVIGLDDQAHMDRYCYYVAGVVGEMLTKLFCEYSPEIAQHKAKLIKLSVSFGQGLQMTNILKDIWADNERGACWLPRSVFEEYGYDLKMLTAQSQRTETDLGDSLVGNNVNSENFEQALTELLGIAHGHLQNAFNYTLLIPRNEQGIRKFCLWAIGMAMLTLRKINKNKHFISGDQVKISRRSVKATILASNLSVRHDNVLKVLFKLSSTGLPPAQGDLTKL